jgi:hypothetical protein
MKNLFSYLVAAVLVIVLTVWTMQRMGFSIKQTYDNTFAAVEEATR